MLYRVIAFLKFILSATNQHGVHSPFIYSYVTKCLYKKSDYKGAKSKQVLLKSMAYFKPKSICLDPYNKKLQGIIKEKFPQTAWETKPFDILYFECLNKASVHSVFNADLIHNNTMVLVSDIHENKEATTYWQSIKNNEKVSVTVDMYYCGAIFFRKEQAKEHFKIRI